MENYDSCRVQLVDTFYARILLLFPASIDESSSSVAVMILEACRHVEMCLLLSYSSNMSNLMNNKRFADAAG